MDIKQEIAKPEWLDDGLLHAEQVFRLAREDKIPDVIKGWMIKTACLRVLRSIYGSDLDTASAIRDHCIKQEMRELPEENVQGTR